MAAGQIEIVAAGTVHFAAGVPAWQGGMHPGFTGVIDDTGVGDINLHMNPPLDEGQCRFSFTVHGTNAAPANVTFSVVHTDDVSKQVLIFREGAAGAISAAADVDFDVVVFKVLSP